MTGYLHSGYADSLSEFGEPRLLPKSQGWILERTIPGSCSRDAMGCYPLFSCRDWSRLDEDLEDLGTDWISLSLVTDPFGSYDTALLKKCFKDLVIPFKEHFVVDLTRPMRGYVSAHHYRYATKALRTIDVIKCEKPTDYVDKWTGLYQHLIKRHSIKGISAFSRNSFLKQLEVPGLVLFRACRQNELVGMTAWYVQEDSAYYHLGAYSATGYKLHASFALFWAAIEYLTETGSKRLNLGAGAGVHGNSEDGLTRFKMGWSTGTQTAYLCGRIF